jgi:voltage-dependent potassium channel beta subunit
MVEADRMEYRSLGRSGVKVSVLSFGNMFSTPDTEQLSFECLDRSLRAGVNFLDTAEVYGKGMQETIFGRNLKQGGWDRDDLVISAKLNPGTSMVGIQGLSRKRIRSAMHNSLKRMQLDNADILFLHRYDYEVPLLESIRAVNQLIDDDVAYYWGTSEFTATELTDCHRLCELHGLIPPIAEQCEYNLFTRQVFEVEYAPLYERYGMGTTVWGPLAGGVLAGRFNDGEVPADSRYMTSASPIIRKFLMKYFANKEETATRLRNFATVAAELGCSQPQLALAWVAKSSDVSTAIYGASKPQYVDDNVQALDVLPKLTPEVLQRIEDIFETRPEPRMCWNTWTPKAPRR